MTRRIVKWSPPYRGENVERPVFDLVDIERDGPIGRIILNSPEKRNPLGYERLLQIEMAAKELELDDDVRVIIIKGAGPCFSAGYDITPTPPGEPKRNTPENGYHHPDRDTAWQAYDHEHLRIYTSLFDLQKPVIAQIHGHCLAGGSELAAFCDLRIVADDAKIGWPVGRHWSPGNLQVSPWLMGMTRAKYYMFTSEPISGKQAAEWAWASESVPADELEERTEAIARKIALTPTDLIMLTKRSINRQFEIMGFKTGMASSADHLAIALLRPSFARGDEFMARAQQGGLRAALDWREEHFDNDYSGGGESREATAPGDTPPADGDGPGARYGE
ncbi:enoyl-CoA hydratase-related protein [Novosphingobium sp. KCTC 2891]|uniref:enoyl-CoA hydratase-related protein n=1 Tax=Novosphingobium sp. KCTC 2891 TaxID=2989730 RepID=UPI002223817E|nr:enoyl-CoA hydratase-related protein [Novosphingobium sp. KCTC 2891]MCW1384679.1 enoyl-CoA hydratase-related protein [Novosphingobium sp. KCTC 2891]